jgi:hypothetical protein
VSFEKPVVLKVAHDYNNKTNVLQLFKVLSFSTCALALNVENFMEEQHFRLAYKVIWYFFFLKIAP